MSATLKSRFPEIIAELRPRLSMAVKAGAELIAEDARANVHDAPPMGVGLKQAIHVERKGAAEYAVVAGDDEVVYGHMVEFGHADRGGGQVAPRPFLIPAKEQRADDVAALLTAVLRSL